MKPLNLEKMVSNFPRLRGFTLVWKNLFYFKKHNDTEVTQRLFRNGWHYNEIESLNLRFTESKIIQFFCNWVTRKPLKYSVEKKPIRNKIGITAEFILE